MLQMSAAPRFCIKRVAARRTGLTACERQFLRQTSNIKLSIPEVYYVLF